MAYKEKFEVGKEYVYKSRATGIVTLFIVTKIEKDKCFTNDFIVWFQKGSYKYDNAVRATKLTKAIYGIK